MTLLIWFECLNCGRKIEALQLDKEFEKTFSDFYDQIRDHQVTISNIHNALYVNNNVEDDKNIDYQNALNDELKKLEKLEARYKYIDNIDFDYDPLEDISIPFLIKDELEDEYKIKNRVEYSHSFICPKCQNIIDVLLFGDHYEYKTDNRGISNDIFLYKSFQCIEGLILNGKSFTVVKGREIKEVLEFLLRFWSINLNKVYFISPFINFNDWFSLASIYKIMKFWWSKPDFYLITRENSMDNYLNKVAKKDLQEIEEKIKFISELVRKNDYIKLRGATYFKKQSPITKKSQFSLKALGEFKNYYYDLFFGVERRITHKNIKNLINDVVKTRIITNKSFHAKFYASYTITGLEREVQLINTSFNYLTTEEKQLETFSFVTIPADEFDEIIKAFSENS